jgi:hypothetical protein
MEYSPSGLEFVAQSRTGIGSAALPADGSAVRQGRNSAGPVALGHGLADALQEGFPVAAHVGPFV